jgi:hypothetical protein
VYWNGEGDAAAESDDTLSSWNGLMVFGSSGNGSTGLRRFDMWKPGEAYADANGCESDFSRRIDSQRGAGLKR